MKQRTDQDIPSLIHATALMGTLYMEWAQKAQLFEKGYHELEARLSKAIEWADINGQTPLSAFLQGQAESLPRAMVPPKPKPEPEPETKPQPAILQNPLPLRDSAKMPHLQPVDPEDVL